MNIGICSVTKNQAAADFAIGSPGEFILEPVTGLLGLAGLSFWLRFAYGSGGTSIKSFLQTSLDQGVSWVDIACIAFAGVSKTRLLNFTAAPRLTPYAPTDGALADDTAVDGILGDRVRLKNVIVGNYVDSLLVGRIHPR